MSRFGSPAAGLTTVAAASAVAGALGYAITILAARALGVDYGSFGVFWSALYFGVGALAGAQQEFARMTRSRGVSPGAIPESDPEARVRRAIGAAAIASVLLAGAATVTLALTALESDPVTHALAVGVGLAAFGLYAVLLGLQYGARRWRVVAIATIADPLLRLALIWGTIEVGGGLTGAIWAAVDPFPILAGALMMVALRDDSLHLEEPAGAAVRAAGLVVAGGAASSFIVNGVPLLFALVAPNEDPGTVSRYVFAFILIRAPLVVSALALQSFLVVHLRDHARPGQLIGRLVGAVAGATGLATALIVAVGESLIRVVGDGVGVPSTEILIGVTVAAGTTCALVVVGCWALARGGRSAFASGWWAAAIAMVLLAAALPGDVETRITLASAAAPLIGIIAIAIAIAVAMRFRP